MTGHVETEFKLRTARSLEIARVDAAVRESTFACANATSRRHNDIYLDDSRRSLAHSGVGLRVRIDDGHATICCKNRGQRDGAKFVRQEHEATWPSPTTPPSAAALPAALRDSIEPITLRRPLIPVLRLDVDREIRELSLDSEPVCELAVDHVVAHGAGRSVQFSEVELEVLNDLPSCEMLAEQLTQSLDVHAANNDKPTHSARLLGLPHPDTPRPLDPEAPTSAAIQAVFHCDIAGMQLAESQVRQDCDPFSVRRMRIALRRLRTLASAFKELWPTEQSRWMRAHLRALAAELGRVRDLDAMRATLRDELPHFPGVLLAGGERLICWLEQTATTARTDLVEWLRSPGRLDDAQRFVELVPQFDAEREIGEPTIFDSARACLNRYATKLRRRTRNLTTASAMPEFHNALLAAKRLGHLAEELGDLAELDLNKVRKRLGKLQRTLARLCDADSTITQLHRWTPRILEDCADQPLTGPALGAFLQQRWHELAELLPTAVETARRERRRLRLPS